MLKVSLTNVIMFLRKGAQVFNLYALKQPLTPLYFAELFLCQSQTYLKEIFHEIAPYYNRKMQCLASVNFSLKALLLSSNCRADSKRTIVPKNKHNI